MNTPNTEGTPVRVRDIEVIKHKIDPPQMMNKYL